MAVGRIRITGRRGRTASPPDARPPPGSPRSASRPPGSPITNFPTTNYGLCIFIFCPIRRRPYLVPSCHCDHKSTVPVLQFLLPDPCMWQASRQAMLLISKGTMSNERSFDGISLSCHLSVTSIN
uniref:Uncharacterized protein n=1 Tax=Rousettus aegyptiacus TaxID=9407 RepID=A0A7J8CI87_ROUAE|nr:hypothetical protein HJG63_009047 [Rousettus aegyptiacus]